MEYRSLGASGLRVSALGFGAGTFGGSGPLFSAWGDTGEREARRLLDMAIAAGVNFFDTADVYSDGASERILGAALKGRRDKVVVSTKTALRLGDGPNDLGASRNRLLRAVDASLQRLGTDYIDLLQLHAFDARTPLEETMATLDGLVRAGKLRYIGASNFSGWQLMKALAIADRHGHARPVAHQVHYSLVGRDYEWELMPLGLDQGVGAVVWSPLGWGRLTGRIRRGQPLPHDSRLQATVAFAPPVDGERLFRVTDALEEVATESGRPVPQIALNWLLQRPGIATILIGARNAPQLEQNLATAGWALAPAQVQRLDAASATTPPYPYYPYWNGMFTELDPPAVAPLMERAP